MAPRKELFFIVPSNDLEKGPSGGVTKRSHAELIRRRNELSTTLLETLQLLDKQRRVIRMLEVKKELGLEIVRCVAEREPLEDLSLSIHSKAGRKRDAQVLAIATEQSGLEGQLAEINAILKPELDKLRSILKIPSTILGGLKEIFHKSVIVISLFGAVFGIYVHSASPIISAILIGGGTACALFSFSSFLNPVKKISEEKLEAMLIRYTLIAQHILEQRLVGLTSEIAGTVIQLLEAHKETHGVDTATDPSSSGETD
ncbi:hypothetical protein KKF81_05720 [Candidatus Micrarchaeota archaeon]|nr:hypothetical protein [Candidatus Micrarchaeota archaeon]MBU1166427.1 hypothetical protein [Candidatus Micrarchaeota archaeon]MBU1887458.1 hypothetical protein [Candidatus Micrarchaeota archaeon]